MIVQTINKEYLPLEKAIAYFSVMSSLNGLGLTTRDIQLLAYTNKRGTISSITAKQEFCRIFGSSIPTVNNMISKLKKRLLLVKQKNRIVVNPVLNLDFTQSISLNITIKTKNE